jgi:hypothetical protein
MMVIEVNSKEMTQMMFELVELVYNDDREVLSQNNFRRDWLCLTMSSH